MVIHTCEQCNFSTEYIWVYNSHLLSNKHINLQTSDHEYTYTCKYCTKKYRHASGLSKHKKICKKKPVSPEKLLERITQLENQINQNKKVIPVVEIQYIYLIQEREFIKTG